MRLHSLRLFAVGPFADEQLIDFDRLSAGGLFLFEGPTGVGKSTILDALTFALYGGLASDAGDPARLRSDFAPAVARPEVELEFSVRGTRHRITRSPEHERPKRRGSGTTRERSSVHLQRLEAGSWASCSHAKDEVGTLVTELVGLNREQFRQVVLLPQGEFATFLRADDDQRRDVLVKLFGTHFYRRLAEELQARAQGAGQALAEAEAAVRARVAAACEAAQCGVEEGAALLGLAAGERLDRLREVGERMDAVARSASDACARADAARAAADGARDAAGRLLDRVRRRSAQVAVLAEVETTRTQHEEDVRRLSRARRAAAVRPLLEDAQEAGRAAATARESVRGAGGVGEQLIGRGAADLTARAQELRSRADRLEHLVAQEQGLPELDQQRVDAHAELAEAREGQARVASRAEALPSEIRSAEAEARAARSLALEVPVVQARFEALRVQLAGAAEAATLEVGVAGLREQRRAAQRAQDEAADNLELLRTHRLADVRGQLAAQLVNGDPCLVCGSPEHPAPAAPAGPAVSEERVRAAEHALGDAQVAVHEADIALMRGTLALERARAAAGGRVAGDLQADLAALEAALRVASDAAARVAELDTRVGDLRDEQAVVAGRLSTLRARVEAAESAVAAREREIAEREASLADARGPFPTVAARVADDRSSAAAHDRLGNEVRELGRALADLDRCVSRAHGEARAAGFASVAEASAAVLAPPALTALEVGVDEWEQRAATARARLAEPELADVADVNPERAEADAQGASAAALQAQDALLSAQVQADTATRQAARFRDLLAEVVCATEQWEALARVSEEVVALDQYARGMAGHPRMTLVTYVLRFWFEQVVAAANLRLDAMSAGKYQLVRIDEGARRDSRVGLGLSVLDRHTGRERSPGTLSGGESFYTSLSLALGLADVVTAQAGGAQLDTLFIDEGFGSLDPDTLDDVMAVIDDLRSDGRVVGIVSHVPELKERVAERLSVRRVRPDGPSTVRVIA